MPVVWTLLLLRIVSGLPNADLDVRQFTRIAVIPDVHADLETAQTSLFLAYQHVVPESGITIDDFRMVLSPGRFLSSPSPMHRGVAIVQLGDLIDKGTESWECVALFGRAERVLGVKVFILYGNHELVAMMHYDYGDQINPGEIWNRDVAFQPEIGQIWKHMHKKYVGMLRIGSPMESPMAEVSKELDGTLFVHAGIELDWLLKSGFVSQDACPDINLINQLLAERIKAENEQLLDDASFLLTRTFSRDNSVCERIDAILTLFQVNRVVVGHTIQFDHTGTRRMSTRCDGKIVLADIGSSRWIYGKVVTDPLPAILAMSFGDGKLVDMREIVFIQEDKSVPVEPTEQVVSLKQSSQNVDVNNVEAGKAIDMGEIVFIQEDKSVQVEPTEQMVSLKQSSQNVDVHSVEGIIYEDGITRLQLQLVGDGIGILQTIHVPGVVKLVKDHVCDNSNHVGVPTCKVLAGPWIFYTTSSVEKIFDRTSHDIKEQIEDIITYFHKRYFTLLYSAKASQGWEWLQKFFAIDLVTRRVQIINFSRFAFETNPIVIRREFNFVRQILEAI